MDKTYDPNIIDHEAFKLYGRATVPEIYVEGWSQLFIGYPNTRIVFHTLVEPQSAEHKEFRKAAATLVIPLGTAIQLAQTILGACKSAEGQLLSISSEAANQLRQLLSAESPSTVPAGVLESDIPPGLGPARPKST